MPQKIARPETIPSGTGDTSSPPPAATPASPVAVPDHELLQQIGGGSYGRVFLARNVMGAYRAVKVVARSAFDTDRPFEREFRGIQNFEPISRSHDSQVDILHVGRQDGCFFTSWNWPMMWTRVRRSIRKSIHPGL